MEGEFDRDIDDSGWGPVTTATPTTPEWHTLSHQIHRLACYEGGLHPQQSSLEIRKKTRGFLQGHLKEAGKTGQETIPLGGILWATHEQMKKQVSALERQIKKETLPIRKRRALKDLEKDKAEVARLAVMWKGLLNQMKPKTPEAKPLLGKVETEVSPSSPLLTPAPPPHIPPSALPTTSLYPILQVTGGSMAVGREKAEAVPLSTGKQGAQASSTPKEPSLGGACGGGAMAPLPPSLANSTPYRNPVDGQPFEARRLREEDTRYRQEWEAERQKMAQERVTRMQEQRSLPPDPPSVEKLILFDYDQEGEMDIPDSAPEPPSHTLSRLFLDSGGQGNLAGAKSKARRHKKPSPSSKGKREVKGTVIGYWKEKEGTEDDSGSGSDSTVYRAINETTCSSHGPHKPRYNLRSNKGIIKTAYPLTRTTGGQKYKAYSLGDLTGLTDKLPPIQDGGGKWLGEIDRLTAGTTMALGDIRAIANRSMSRQIANEIEVEAQTNLHPDDTPFSHVSTDFGRAVRERYPPPNNAAVPKLKWDGKKCPRAHLDECRTIWIQQTGCHPGMVGVQQTWFRNAVLEGVPTEVKTAMCANPDLPGCDAVKWEKHLIHHLTQEQDKQDEKESQQTEQAAQLLRLQLAEARAKATDSKAKAKKQMVAGDAGRAQDDNPPHTPDLYPEPDWVPHGPPQVMYQGPYQEQGPRGSFGRGRGGYGGYGGRGRSRGGYGQGGLGVCYTCGSPRHWSRNCPHGPGHGPWEDQYGPPAGRGDYPPRGGRPGMAGRGGPPRGAATQMPLQHRSDPWSGWGPDGSQHH